MSIQRSCVILFAAAAVATGCGGGGGGGGGLWIPIPVSIPPVVIASNSPDDFDLAVVTYDYDGAHTYSWSCSDSQANIAVGVSGMGGSMNLQIIDAAGVVVHDNRYDAVMGSVSAVTSPGGVPGTWMLNFSFSDATWTGDVSVEADAMNDPDVIQVNGAFSFNGTLAYAVGWSAGPAIVEWAGWLNSGSIRVRVWSPTGTLTYDQSFGAGALSFADWTATGDAGTWLVQLDFNNAAATGASLRLDHP